MINLRISTPDGRTTIISERSKTPRDIIQEQDLITDGATISLDGVPLQVAELGRTFEELRCGESATLSVVVKTGNA